MTQSQQEKPFSPTQSSQRPLHQKDGLTQEQMAFAGVVGRALAGKWRQECKCRPTTDPDDTSASSPITESS